LSCGLDVARILGDTTATIERHYAKWSLWHEFGTDGRTGE
jgi:hypothetical protein